ncbi:Transferase (fragment) [Paraburkholderia piptadeniae]|uniref:Transferase n=1 Tax=Paraburkholderia piptadeniae TaxID=1701573 RepID=A0A1N7SUR5_9BURK
MTPAPAEGSASNLIVFAGKGKHPLPAPEILIERASHLAHHHTVDLVEAAVRIGLGVSCDWRRSAEPLAV